MQLQKQKSLKKVAITVYTWFKDSYCLFDYESPKTSQCLLEVPLQHMTWLVYRRRSKQNQVHNQSESDAIAIVEETSNNQKNPAHWKLLNKFEVVPPSEANPSPQVIFHNSYKRTEGNEEAQDIEVAFKTISTKDRNNRAVPQKEIKVEVGQIIKFGRVEFLVREIKEKNQVVHSVKSKSRQSIEDIRKEGFEQNNDTDTEEPKQQEQYECRICLQKTDLASNKLLKPCACTGTCALVHATCLAIWIKTKVVKEFEGACYYNFDNLHCQICGADLCQYINCGSMTVELIKIDRPTVSYMILESNCDKEKSLIVVSSVPVQGIRLGRSQQCSIRLGDISVSRNHASIFERKDGFYLQDNLSKFGTLFKEMHTTTVNLNDGSSNVQIGRSLFSFSLKQRV